MCVLYSSPLEGYIPLFLNHNVLNYCIIIVPCLLPFNVFPVGIWQIWMSSQNLIQVSKSNNVKGKIVDQCTTLRI